MNLSLFDTHCDTAYELFRRGVGLEHNQECHVSLDKAAVYHRYAQFYAVWSDRRLDDEACWEQFLQITDYFQRELEKNAEHAARVTSASQLEAVLSAGKHAAILAVEDARLTAGKIQRLDEMYARGVRYLTLLWGGDTCIGGSHDTQHGLTDFGRAVVRGCFERGIIPDVSHASEQAVDDLLPIARAYGKPVIASHSNAYGVYGHSRNLRDHHFLAIRELGGIVGISLCPQHLTDTSLRPAAAEDILRHIEHYLALGGEDMIGFGADWDGTDLPDGIDHVGHLTRVAECMAAHGYSDSLIRKLFWDNFYRFSIKNL
jgi:membrane dipeptidase